MVKAKPPPFISAATGVPFKVATNMLTKNNSTGQATQTWRAYNRNGDTRQSVPVSHRRMQQLHIRRDYVHLICARGEHPLCALSDPVLHQRCRPKEATCSAKHRNNKLLLARSKAARRVRTNCRKFSVSRGGENTRVRWHRPVGRGHLPCALFGRFFARSFSTLVSSRCVQCT